MENNLEPEVREKLLRVKAVVLDSVGVVFSSAVYFSTQEGEVLRMRSHTDGQGITFLRGSGIEVAMITSEKSGFLDRLGEKLNNLESVKSGRIPKMAVFVGDEGRDKVRTIESWLTGQNLSFSECAYMGDDVGDYEIMKRVGFRICPSDSADFIKNISEYVTKAKGGDGAIREFADLLLKARGIDVLSLPIK